jgi:hypothetical protein
VTVLLNCVDAVGMCVDNYGLVASFASIDHDPGSMRQNLEPRLFHIWGQRLPDRTSSCIRH